MDPRQYFPRLNKHFNVKHIEHDFSRGGESDLEVYRFAVLEKRIILTRNAKHFQILVGTENDVGCIKIPPHWTPAKIDTRLTAILMRYGSTHFNGKLHSLTGD